MAAYGVQPDVQHRMACNRAPGKIITHCDTVSRRGLGGADPGIQGQRTGGWTGERAVGRSVGWAGAAARRHWSGGGERERKRDLFLREDKQEVAWRGKGSLHASALLWDTYTSCVKPCPGYPRAPLSLSLGS